MSSEEYRYRDADLSCSHRYLLPLLIEWLEELAAAGFERRIFDLGCGNGSVAAELSRRGWQVTGVDPSREGIRLGKRSYPELELEIGSSDEDLRSRFGEFPIVISLEVVEHLVSPRRFAGCVAELLEPGGAAIVSTPYHGYWKNLALALSGRLDAHFTALKDHGHIKFWSVATLSRLLRDGGLEPVRIQRVGRLPPVAKSMVFLARKAPSGEEGRR